MKSWFSSVLLLGYAIVCHAIPSPLVGAHVKRNAQGLLGEYDYIIVGGGLSGLVVANRLTEDPKVSVLVVEYGDFDNTWNTAAPYGVYVTQSAEIVKQAPSTPQPGLGNRVTSVSLGTVVGGGSTVNGMAFDFGSAADYDAWQELGNEGWGWTDMQKYLKKATTFTPPSKEAVEKWGFTWDESVYGNGPYQVGLSEWQWPDLLVQLQASKEMGLPELGDHGAGGTNVGLAFVPQNSSPINRTRSGSRAAYYDPIASDRPNLHLLVRHYVSRVQFRRKRATGVHVHSRNTSDSGPYLLKARKEVILAAGAIRTPSILQHSGVGPRSVLENLGIDVVQDLPGVGRNFQDHPWMLLLYSYLNQNELNASLLSNETYLAQAWDEYFKTRTGPITLARGNAIVFLALQDMLAEYKELASSLQGQDALQFLPSEYSESPELLRGFLAQRAILANHLTRADAGAIEVPMGGSPGGAVALQKPLSRGTVTISSKTYDPDEWPVIDFGTFQNPVDVDILVAGVKWFRRWMNTPSHMTLEPVELVPGSNVTTDEEIRAALRSSVFGSFAHPAGTAAMGPKGHGGVVDAHLRVHGLRGLRVVDASVIPLIPSCHLQATVLAIAEKAADLIKGA